MYMLRHTPPLCLNMYTITDKYCPYAHKFTHLQTHTTPPLAPVHIYRQTLPLCPQIYMFTDIHHPSARTCTHLQTNTAPLPTRTDVASSGNVCPSLSFSLSPFQTLVQACLYPMGRSKDIFREPEIFKPTRWERSEQRAAGGTRPETGFLSLAFGFGARQCVGRRIADNEMQLLLFHVSVT